MTIMTIETYFILNIELALRYICFMVFRGSDYIALLRLSMHCCEL